jgi:hypothetical protein
VSDEHATGLEHALAATPDCVPVARFTETLSDRERQHLEICARCQSELALWSEFEQSHPAADEGVTVSWIVAELARLNQPVSRGAPRTLFGWLSAPMWRWGAAFATVALVTTGVYLLQDREPTPRQLSNTPQTYRTVQLEVRGPVGDLTAAPGAIDWVALEGAVGYDVEVFEVDRTPLWRTTSSNSHVELPAAVVRQFVPGKAILWEVRARNAANRVIAESGTQRFRVAIAGSSPKG